ncbi:MAG: Rho termination factor N-terminal domain-containing protein, partial [Actinomycetota bacterium]
MATEKAALEGKAATELRQMAAGLGIAGTQRLRKAELIESIVERNGAAAGRAKRAATAPEAVPAAAPRRVEREPRAEDAPIPIRRDESPRHGGGGGGGGRRRG